MTTLTEIVSSSVGGEVTTRPSVTMLVSEGVESQILEAGAGYVIESEPGTTLFDPVGTGHLLSTGFRYINVGGVQEETMPYAKRADVDGNYVYRAEAAPGSLDADPVWRVWRISLLSIDGDLSEQFAEGTATFSFAWNDRLTLNYI